MKITTENNSYLLYTIENDKIYIENIKSYQKGDGSILLTQIKIIASDLRLPIELYSEPQDDTITQEELNNFYYKNGFSLHHDDTDNSYFIYK